jgi:hypothetical protein
MTLKVGRDFGCVMPQIKIKRQKRQLDKTQDFISSKLDNIKTKESDMMNERIDLVTKIRTECEEILKRKKSLAINRRQKIVKVIKT